MPMSSTPDGSSGLARLSQRNHLLSGYHGEKAASRSSISRRHSSHFARCFLRRTLDSHYKDWCEQQERKALQLSYNEQVMNALKFVLWKTIQLNKAIQGLSRLCFRCRNVKPGTAFHPVFA